MATTPNQPKGQGAAPGGAGQLRKSPSDGASTLRKKVEARKLRKVTKR